MRPVPKLSAYKPHEALGPAHVRATWLADGLQERGVFRVDPAAVDDHDLDGMISMASQLPSARPMPRNMGKPAA